MNDVSHIYIPTRLYDQLKRIYTEKVSVISAPDGCGKTTILREFIRRSRPDGISCRFITDCSDANECFSRVCRMILGHDEHIPVTAADYSRLCHSFEEASLTKPTLIVLDCAAAQEMLLRNLYCAKLFVNHSPVMLTITCDRLPYHYNRLTDNLRIHLITRKELSLTPEETNKYFSLCGIHNADSYYIHDMVSGNILKTRLCMMILRNGGSIDSFAISELIENALLSRLDTKAWLAILCICSFTFTDERSCKTLIAEESIRRYFGTEELSPSDILDGAERANSIIPLISCNRKKGTYEPHIILKRAAYKRFLKLPEDVQRSFHHCSAKDYMREKKTFRVFCQYYLAGDYESATSVPFAENISFELLMRSKDLIFRFVQECPLEKKVIIPRLLRMTALLMLTPHREQAKPYFEKTIQHLTQSPDYTERERRNILSYAYALRTYEDFYMMEKMGMNIKRAYDLYSGGTLSNPPFYSWSLYTPSVFCLVHRYSIALSTEAEQFVRYHKMYTEMINHGKYGDNLYTAELCYYLGDFDGAISRALEIAEACNDYYIPSRLISLTLGARASLMKGSYDIFTYCTDAIGDILRRNTTSEIGEHAMLCLSTICCLKVGSDEDVWPVVSTPDSELLLNRYSAPFYFFVRCFAMLIHKEYNMLLSKKDHYLNAAASIRNETVYMMIKLTAAVAYLRTYNEDNAAGYLRDVMDTLYDSQTIMPAIEICIHHPQLFVFGQKKLPEKYAPLLKRIIEAAKPLRRSIEAIRTQELTEAGGTEKENHIKYLTLDSSMNAFEETRKKYGLTKKALRYAIYATHGISNEEIASIIGTSTDSVKSSLKRTYAKLGIRSRGQLKHIFRLRE